MDRELGWDVLKKSRSAYGQGPLASSHPHGSLLQLQLRTFGLEWRWCLLQKAKSIRQRLHSPPSMMVGTQPPPALVRQDLR